MTKLYLRDASQAPPSGMPNAEQSSALPAAGATGQAHGSLSADLGLSTSIGVTQTSRSITHDADQNHDDWAIAIYGYNLPVVQDISAQTWTFAFAGSESNAAANTSFEASLYIWRPGTTSVVGFIYDAHVGIGSAPWEELGTTEEGRVGTVSGSAVSGVQSGDQLILEVWHHVLQTMNTAYTSAHYYNGANEPVNQSGVTNAAAYISTPQDLETAPARPLPILVVSRRAA